MLRGILLKLQKHASWALAPHVRLCQPRPSLWQAPGDRY